MGNDDLKAHLARRDALFRQPNALDAAIWWMENSPEAPADNRVPLAAVHKARLQWLDATDDMLAQSKLWLTENGFATDFKGAPPLTPTMRDAQRAALGKPPLAK
jgi:hypothetical protein